MSEVVTVRRAPRPHHTQPMRVVSNQVITTEWAQGLITLAMPVLQELYKKALEAKRAEQPLTAPMNANKAEDEMQRERA